MINYFNYFVLRSCLNVFTGVVSPVICLFGFDNSLFGCCEFIHGLCRGRKLDELFKDTGFQIPRAKSGKRGDKRKRDKAVAFLCRFLSFLCLIPLYLACAVCAVVFIAVAIPVGLIAAVVAFVACLFIGVPILLISSAYRLATGKGFEVDERDFSICSVAFPRESSSTFDVLFYVIIGSACVVMLPVIALCALIIALPAIFYVVACKLENWIVNRNVPDDMQVTDCRRSLVPKRVMEYFPITGSLIGVLTDPFVDHGSSQFESKSEEHSQSRVHRKNLNSTPYHGCPQPEESNLVGADSEVVP